MTTNGYYRRGHHKAGMFLRDFVDGPGGCLLWPGRVTAKGYAATTTKGNKSKQVHRLMYERHHGVALTPDIHLHHVCGVKHCCNPDHLLRVDNAEHGGQITTTAIRRLAAAGVQIELLAAAFQTTAINIKELLA